MLRKFFICLIGVLVILSVVGGMSSYGAPSTPSTALPTIKILGTIPFSGDAANIGPPYDRAIRMAIDELNEAGIPGFAGIDYKVIDTGTSPSVLQKKLAREVEFWNPDLTIGCALETEIRVPCQFVPQYKLPTIVGGHLSMSKYMPPGEVPLSKWVCYYGYSDFYCGWFAGQFFHQMGAKKVAYVGGDYDWGYSNGMGLRAYWEQNGRPFEISPVIYTPLDKTDFATEAEIIKKEKPDALYCVYMGAGWFSFPKQLRDAGAMPKYFLYDPTYSNMGGAKVTGAYGAENIYTLADHDPDSLAWADFVKKWKKRYGQNAFPEAYTNNHYQAIYWFIEAVKKAGPKALEDHELLIDTMHNTSFQNVCISPMGPLGPYGSNWGATGTIIQFQPGAGKVDPSFSLHEVLITKVQSPKKDAKQILEEIKGIQKLENGQVYPAGVQ